MQKVSICITKLHNFNLQYLLPVTSSVTLHPTSLHKEYMLYFTLIYSTCYLLLVVLLYTALFYVLPVLHIILQLSIRRLLLNTICTLMQHITSYPNTLFQFTGCYLLCSMIDCCYLTPYHTALFYVLSLFYALVGFITSLHTITV